MLGRDRAQPGRQFGSVVGSEFIGMHLDLESPGRGLDQVVFRLRVGKIAILAKNIHEFSQVLFLDLRQDLRQQVIEIILVPSLIGLRDLMGAHERGDDAHGMPLRRGSQRLQLLHFGLQVQAIPALGFQGRRAAEQHPVESLFTGCDQVREADGPGLAHRALDAAAAAGDLLVAHPLQLQLEFILARAGEGQVGVRVDQTGKGNASFGIHFQSSGFQMALAAPVFFRTDKFDKPLFGADTHI
jgi:hypothetical protein